MDIVFTSLGRDAVCLLHLVHITPRVSEKRRKNNGKYTLFSNKHVRVQSLFQLLLGAQMVAVATLLLTAVVGAKWKTSVALPTHHLVTIILSSQRSQSGLDHSSSNLKQHFQSCIATDVVRLQCVRILQLLSSE